MTTRTPTAPAIEVADLVGVGADHGFQRLRELGLVPDHVGRRRPRTSTRAGVVIGVGAAAGKPTSPQGIDHDEPRRGPRFSEHADDFVAGQADRLVDLVLTAPGASDSSAVSLSERGGELAQIPRRGVPPIQLW
jgi:hypothetical protein